MFHDLIQPERHHVDSSIPGAGSVPFVERIENLERIEELSEQKKGSLARPRARASIQDPKEIHQARKQDQDGATARTRCSNYMRAMGKTQVPKLNRQAE